MGNGAGTRGPGVPIVSVARPLALLGVGRRACREAVGAWPPARCLHPCDLVFVTGRLLQVAQNAYGGRQTQVGAAQAGRSSATVGFAPSLKRRRRRGPDPPPNIQNRAGDGSFWGLHAISQA